MNPDKRIAIDAMGGDGGAGLTVPASLDALRRFPGLALTLVGDESRIRPLLAGAEPALLPRCEVLHAERAIADRDRPAGVLRSGRESSMYLAVELVRSGGADAMVSAGNTGALLMIGRHLLKTIDGIQKPAMVAAIPGSPRRCYLLDVGANPDCDARQLFEFAVMGSVLAGSLAGAAARVGLLNIGVEEHKGTEEVRRAALLLEACGELNYVGFVEADELFAGAADVVVCDGYVGNVTIKASAGAAGVVQRTLARRAPAKRTGGRLSALLARLAGPSPAFAFRLSALINPQRFNGASLLGLQGSVVKSHGNATAEGFVCAIQQAVREVENAVPRLIADKVAAIMAAH